MQDFAQKAEEYLLRAEKQYQPPFETEYQVEYCGEVFPMVSQFQKREDRYMFGLKSGIATEGLCGEKCFFSCCETLDKAALDKYQALFRQIQDEQVPAADSAHDFTLISLVVCTQHVSRAMQRAIKRVNDYREYKKTGYGWSALRICVVDLEDGQYYYNPMGKAVMECLTRDGMPKPQKKLFNLF